MFLMGFFKSSEGSKTGNGTHRVRQLCVNIGVAGGTTLVRVREVTSEEVKSVLETRVM
jgi:hypothetical protein